MPFIKPLFFAVMLGCVTTSPLHAGGEHNDSAHADENHHDDSPTEARGPHGGIALHQDDASVELLIFERGVPPQYRAWVSQDGRAVTEDITLSVALTRLGGHVDNFAFTHQGDYWLGDGVVTEPHSFDVHVTLSMAGKDYIWQWESHEGRTQIGADMAQASGITTSEAGPGSIERRMTTYGMLTTAPQQMARLSARFPGLVTQVNVTLGERVSRGDALAQIESNQSLQSYALRAPISGTVIEQRISSGELAGEEPLFTLADLSTLWVELKVFPGQRAEVEVGQTVRLQFQGGDREARIEHLLPSPDRAPYTLARLQIDNADAALGPGLLVTGDIVLEVADVPLAVDNRALQSFRDWTVVFIQVGDRYEIRPLELGRSDGRLTEVLGGLQAGDRYVVGNSYLIKADIEKSGASHDH